MRTVNEFIKDIYDYNLKYKDFFIKTIDTAKYIGSYVGIDTKDFYNSFYAGTTFFSTLYGEDNGKYNVYCIKKENDNLSIIWYYSDINSDIYLVRAHTIQIDLTNKTFIYHNFENKNCKWQVNIEHRKITGEIPYILFTKNNTYNIEKTILNKDLRREYISENSLFEVIDRIEESKSKKEYIDNDNYIWEPNKEMNYYYQMYPELCSVVENLSKEEALEIIKNYDKLDGNERIRIIYELDLIDYDRNYKITKNNKIKELTKILK